MDLSSARSVLAAANESTNGRSTAGREPGSKASGRLDPLAMLDAIFGPDAGLKSGGGAAAAEEGEESSQVQSALSVTGGDLTFGDENAPDELRLSGLTEELERYQDQQAVRDILKGGQDVRDLSRDVEEKLRSVELESINDYMRESSNLLTLHSQIKGCDLVLSQMEALLSGFQADLGAVSAEIKSLQEKSMGMGVKLRNRKAAGSKLARFVEEMAVSPELISDICDGEVNDAFIKSLQVLNRKLHFIAEEAAARSSSAAADVQPELERLRVKAMIKAREFLMQKIYALRKPKTNIHILQHNVLLKYKYLAVFLKEHGRVLYNEVIHSYVEIMSKVLCLHLKTYIASLERLQLDIVSRNDLICAEDPHKSASGNIVGLFGAARSSRDLKNRSSVFSLGERAAVLTDIDAGAIIPHVAEGIGQKLPYEVLFRSLHRLLIDSASSEYLFCSEFFGDEATFFSVFSAPFALVEDHVVSMISSSFDAVGLLLMIRITKQLQDQMVERRVPCVDAYLDKVTMALWPRFKVVFDSHLSSVKSANAKTLWEDDVHPHFVARRYAEFAASMATINTDYGDNQLELNLERLRSAVDHLLVELSRMFPRQKQRSIFLINNYDMILAVLKEAGAHDGKTQQQFEELLTSFTAMFVEEELIEFFGGLVKFVRTRAGAPEDSSGGGSAARGGSSGNVLKSPGKPIALQEIAPHVKDFASRWKVTIEAMHKDIITNFSNFVCGMDILRAALTQLLLYYTRLSDTLKRVEGGATLMKDVVSIPSIMYEIRKYSLTF